MTPLASFLFGQVRPPACLTSISAAIPEMGAISATEAVNNVPIVVVAGSMRKCCLRSSERRKEAL